MPKRERGAGAGAALAGCADEGAGVRPEAVA